jgi:hypothetical protein
MRVRPDLLAHPLHQRRRKRRQQVRSSGAKVRGIDVVVDRRGPR